jgi:hypothetical protein
MAAVILERSPHLMIPIQKVSSNPDSLRFGSTSSLTTLVVVTAKEAIAFCCTYHCVQSLSLQIMGKATLFQSEFPSVAVFCWPNSFNNSPMLSKHLAEFTPVQYKHSHMPCMRRTGIISVQHAPCTTSQNSLVLPAGCYSLPSSLHS